MESVVPANVAQGEEISAKYELVGRGTYSASNEHIQNAIFGIDRTTPLELFEARNALRIAHIAAGDKYANSILAKADGQLKQAEDAYRQKQGKIAVESAARETAQTAEEARVMAVKQRAEDEAQAKAAAEKKAAEDREAQADDERQELHHHVQLPGRARPVPRAELLLRRSPRPGPEMGDQRIHAQRPQRVADPVPLQGHRAGTGAPDLPSLR